MCLLCIPLVVFPATSDFTINTLVGSDTTAPTIPGAVVATPVATTQINLTWASSTDNVAVAGYHVWRDDVQIATTTVAAYSDIGLVASTTYSYYIVAFDTSFNFSASSSVVMATTLGAAQSVTTTPSEEGSSRFGSRRTTFDDLLETIRLVPTETTIGVTFTTKEFVRTTVRWGNTTEYELGTMGSEVFAKNHRTLVTGLAPHTQYYIEIIGMLGSGRTGVIHRGVVTTVQAQAITQPSNVSSLQAIRDGDRIRMTWENPPDPDFDRVRIVRNDLFYPVDFVDGKVVYEGEGESYSDTWDTKTHGQYYTVFTYNANGSISSGAVVAVFDSTISTSTATSSPFNPVQNKLNLSITDFQFFQEGVVIPIEDGRIRIDGSRQLTILVPYEKMPEHLKTILVRVDDAGNTSRSFTFLLRINKEKTAYTSTLAPLGRTGEYPIHISVLDYETQQVGYASGILDSRVVSMPIAGTQDGWILGLLTELSRSYFVWLLLLLLIFILIGRQLVHQNQVS